MSKRTAVKSLRAASVVVAVGLLAACGGTDGDTTTAVADTDGTVASGPASSGSVTVGVVMSGPANDGGFYEAGNAGVLRAEDELGVETLLLENVAPPNGEQAFRDLVAQGADLVIGMGAEFEDAAIAVAPDEPDVSFALMNGRAPMANLAVYQLREAQVAYLATRVVLSAEPDLGGVGLVAGVEIPPHLLLRDAMQAAVATAGSGARFVSTFTNDFNDAALAKEAALAQIRNGADLVVPWTGAAVDGVLLAAREEGVQAISSLVDRCGSDESIVASAVADPGGLIFRVVREFLADDWKGDGSTAIGLEDPEVVRVIMCDEMSDAAQAVHDELLDALVSGDELPGLPEGV